MNLKWYYKTWVQEKMVLEREFHKIIPLHIQ